MLANAEEESKLNRGLFEKNFISRARLLQLESRSAEVASMVAENAAEISRARQKITEAQTTREKLKNDWLSTVLEDLRKTQEAHAAALERLTIVKDRLARTRVVAPQDGTVNGLRFTTIGGVVPPGGVMLDVTPSSDQLVVEAHLSPDDIDVVHPDLPARVRLTAYKARRHFSLKGKVTQISSDTFKDDRSGRSYYKIRVEIPDSELQGVDRMTLVPGMLAQAEVVTGERSAFRYLIDPVVESFHRAMKEK
jgi:HlyD family type I secretion membrane fusion protein